ncbi:MAG: bifunctional UDP-N-acetylglucosamine diphosphorylase/glucosamine-1-phosphate N-acetyltransferase GlmU [Thermoguttaceae bacterium]|nr:bifunctional UDP-N-acetylglucosamine diphosphorylase/glucosamine-1-phosphate N-acetyltransferase GlmU [Thermoguttaceae bacterium]
MIVVILAAGMGKRMYSDKPKVVHGLAGKPMVAHVVDTAASLGAAKTVVVVGHGAGAVKDVLAGKDVSFALQDRQLGTGHAVSVALDEMAGHDTALILYGDVPLVSTGTLSSLVKAASDGSLAVLTLEIANPYGYGRIVRKAGKIIGIVEEKDATDLQRAIREINTGIMAAPVKKLAEWLPKLKNSNAQGEYYLTDIVAMAVSDGVNVEGVFAANDWETTGVNSKVQLEALERRWQKEQATRLLTAGVTLADSSRIDIRGSLECGRDVYIDVNCVFEGTVKIASGAMIGPNCVIRDCVIGEGAEIRAFSHLEGATVGAESLIGPYARLRPGAKLGREVHIGNFVEVKNSEIADKSKANHLAYVGDSTVGTRVNIGAGAITCNYDGANKHRTVIGDDAFIGTNCELVAPVSVGARATIGAGTTLTRDVPDDTLAVTRAKQTTVTGWKRPTKNKG